MALVQLQTFYGAGRSLSKESRARNAGGTGSAQKRTKTTSRDLAAAILSNSVTASAAPVTPTGGGRRQPTPRLHRKDRASRPKIGLSLNESVPDNIRSEIAYLIVKKSLQLTQDAEVTESMIMRECHVANKDPWDAIDY